jgi:hypothetical protein
MSEIVVRPLEFLGVYFRYQEKGSGGKSLEDPHRPRMIGWWRVAVGEEDMVGMPGIGAARAVKEPSGVALRVTFGPGWVWLGLVVDDIIAELVNEEVSLATEEERNT